MIEEERKEGREGVKEGQRESVREIVLQVLREVQSADRRSPAAVSTQPLSRTRPTFEILTSTPGLRARPWPAPRRCREVGGAGRTRDAQDLRQRRLKDPPRGGTGGDAKALAAGVARPKLRRVRAPGSGGAGPRRRRCCRDAAETFSVATRIDARRRRGRDPAEAASDLTRSRAVLGRVGSEAVRGRGVSRDPPERGELAAPRSAETVRAVVAGLEVARRTKVDSGARLRRIPLSCSGWAHSLKTRAVGGAGRQNIGPAWDAIERRGRAEPCLAITSDACTFMRQVFRWLQLGHLIKRKRGYNDVHRYGKITTISTLKSLNLLKITVNR